MNNLNSEELKFMKKLYKFKYLKLTENREVALSLIEKDLIIQNQYYYELTELAIASYDKLFPSILYKFKTLF